MESDANLQDSPGDVTFVVLDNEILSHGAETIENEMKSALV